MTQNNGYDFLSVPSPGEQSPATNERRHIQFSDKAEQCITVYAEDDGDDEDRGDIYTIRGGDEDGDGMVTTGLFGQMADAVNTAKDIAYVLWNVGWR